MPKDLIITRDENRDQREFRYQISDIFGRFLKVGVANFKECECWRYADRDVFCILRDVGL